MTPSSSPKKIVVVIQDDPPNRLDKALARDVPEELALSRTQLLRAIKSGCVSINGQVVDNPKANVLADTQIELSLPEPVALELDAYAMSLDVLFEDDEVIVVNKPSGLVVHPAPGTVEPTLVHGLLAHCGESLRGIGGVERPGIVHRLDKDTSGLLVIAKTDLAHHSLSEQFAARTVSRRYLCLCHGVPRASDARLSGLPIVEWREGGSLIVDAPIGRHPRDRQRQAINSRNGKHAVTCVKLITALNAHDDMGLISCKLETGRTHQIRVHLSAIGYPVVADPIYGQGRSLSASRFNEKQLKSIHSLHGQALHAAELGFCHPRTKDWIFLQTAPPADFLDVLKAFDVKLP